MAINPENKCGMPCLPLERSIIPGSYFRALTLQLNFTQDTNYGCETPFGKQPLTLIMTGACPIWFY
jgi:hypothetical protein